jgi:hypothetical protein
MFLKYFRTIKATFTFKATWTAEVFLFAVLTDNFAATG